MNALQSVCAADRVVIVTLKTLNGQPSLILSYNNVGSHLPSPGGGGCPAASLLLSGRVVLPAGGSGPPPGPVPARGTRRHGGAGHSGTRPPARHRPGSHEQRALPQGVRLRPLLPLHAQRRLRGRASPGRHRGGGGHHHPLPTGPLHRRRVRAAEPHRDLGRQVLLPGAEVRVDEGRAGVRRDVLQAERGTLQSGQDHAAPLQEEGRVSRVSRRPATLGQFHLCQQPGSQSGEWPRGEEQMNGPLGELLLTSAFGSQLNLRSEGLILR